MKTFVWHEKYVTGLGSVDEQHLRLVGLINAFAQALADQTRLDRSGVDATFMALSLYARDHFADEEELMHAAGLDPRFLEEHQRQHRGFIANVTEMNQSLREGMQPGDDLGRGLMGFLVDWLGSHILRTDQRMARQMKAIGAGVAPAEAFGKEALPGHEGAALLAGALHELLRAVGERNRQLAEANRTLEERVAERTADLGSRNLELQRTIRELKDAHQRLLDASKLVAVGQLASGLAGEIRGAVAQLSTSFDAMADAHARLKAVVAVYQRLEPLIADSAGRTEAARARDELARVGQGLASPLNDGHEALDRLADAVRDLEALAGEPEAD